MERQLTKAWRATSIVTAQWGGRKLRRHISRSRMEKLVTHRPA